MPEPKPPQPVEVKNVEPLQVELSEPAAPTPVQTRDGSLSLPPQTTEQEDIVTAGQRQINLIWECTQAIIAVSITGAVIYVSVVEIESQILTSGFFLIIGFYFSRVNHNAIGGIGRKATDDLVYRGR